MFVRNEIERLQRTEEASLSPPVRHAA